MRNEFYGWASLFIIVAASMAMMGISNEKEGAVVIAHRGASAVAPENTGSAIREAIRLGARVVEFDVRQTKDGKLVLFHDDELKRVTGRKGTIESSDWEVVSQLDVGKWFGQGAFAGEAPIRLHEAIQLCVEGNATALIEHKSGTPDNYAEVIRSLDAADEIIVQSFDWAFLREFRAGFPEVRIGALGSKRLTTDRLESLQLIGSEWVGWKFSDLTESNFNSLQKLGFRVALWTVNDPVEAKRWIDRGANGIITDYPDRILDILPGQR